jgi:nitrogen regulatory protein PII
MKAIFIPFNQSYREQVVEILERNDSRGFTFMDDIQGRGTKKGEPHYGTHAWPTLNSAIIAMVADEKVDNILAAIKTLDEQTEKLGLHAFVWNIEKMV